MCFTTVEDLFGGSLGSVLQVFNSFAVEMIKDRTDTNRHLSELVARLGLNLVPVEQMEQRAKLSLVPVPEGEGCDAVYVAD